MFYKYSIKPFLDIIVSFCLFIILSPIFILVMILLILVNKGKPFFTQKRPGSKGETFSIIKFKTMTDAKDQTGDLLPDSLRMTSVGKFVRKTSLDEIPQLINVIKGEMSLVGPRPLLPEYLKLYNNEQARRHDVKPGISGWAQVNGRNAISWEEKFHFDIWYVDHQSFILDFKILWMTIIKVVAREGISTQGQVTSSKFKGNND